jgi:hypothetical protein
VRTSTEKDVSQPVAHKSSEESSQKKREMKANSKVFNPKLHRMNDRNPDYFTCPASNDTMKANQEKVFRDYDHFFKDLLDKLNTQHGGSMLGLVWNGKSQYAQLKCVYKDCNFSHWFTCDKDLPVRKIRYARSINQNHSIAAHGTGEKRDLK